MDWLIFSLLKDLDFPTDWAFLQASQIDPQVLYLHVEIWTSEAKKTPQKKSQTTKLEYLYFLKLSRSTATSLQVKFYIHLHHTDTNRC